MLHTRAVSLSQQVAAWFTNVLCPSITTWWHRLALSHKSRVPVPQNTGLGMPVHTPAVSWCCPKVAWTLLLLSLPTPSTVWLPEHQCQGPELPHVVWVHLSAGLSCPSAILRLYVTAWSHTCRILALQLGGEACLFTCMRGPNPTL